jgi:diguanylate cyclase (GGDEF)-like protein/PAS domain S-box-containing protein
LICRTRSTSIDPTGITRIPEALRRSEALFRAISDASPLGIFVSDVAGECVYTNAAYHKISGLNFDQALGTNWSKAIHPEDRQRMVAEWRDAAREKEVFQADVRFLRADQSVVWTRLNAIAMRDGETLHGYVQTVEDITERKMVESILRDAEDSLYEAKERAQVTLNSIGDAVVTTDPAGKVNYLNVVAERMTGWSRDDAMGQPLADVFRIIDGATREVAMDPAQRAIAENRTVGLAADCLLVRRDGFEFAIEDSAAPIHDRNGRVTGAVIVFHDVSESRAMAEKMAYLAQHDFLTGLANRALLTERLARAIGLAKRHKKQVALLFVDLDDFKRINDSLGHAVGDQLLKLVADRLVTCVRATDTVCRQGGDEFVILLAEIEQVQDAANVADKLLAALVVPQQVGEHELSVTLSIGISVYPDDSHDVDTVMQNADTAMYQAKAGGRNNYKFYRCDMGAPGTRRLFVE